MLHLSKGLQRGWGACAPHAPRICHLVLWMNNSFLVLIIQFACLLGKVTHSIYPVVICTCQSNSRPVQIHFRHQADTKLLFCIIYDCTCLLMCTHPDDCCRCFTCIVHGQYHYGVNWGLPFQMCMIVTMWLHGGLPGDCRSCGRSIYVHFMHHQLSGVVVLWLLLWQAIDKLHVHGKRLATFAYFR